MNLLPTPSPGQFQWFAYSTADAEVPKFSFVHLIPKGVRRKNKPDTTTVTTAPAGLCPQEALRIGEEEAPPKIDPYHHGTHEGCIWLLFYTVFLVT